MKVLPFLLILALTSTGVSAEVSSMKIGTPQKPAGLNGHVLTLDNGDKVDIYAPPSTRKVDAKLIASEKLTLAHASGKFGPHIMSLCDDTYKWLNENMNDKDWNRIEGMWGRACL